jgi:poly(A) polymerase
VQCHGALAADIVLTGDFNDPRGLPDGPAAVLGLRDAWTEAHGPDDATATFDPVGNPLAAVGSLTGLPGRLDRVLLRGAAHTEGAVLRGTEPGTDGLHISDHYGVQADLTFRPGPRDGDGPAAAAVSASGRP